jgi:hypothetical protein
MKYGSRNGCAYVMKCTSWPRLRRARCRARSRRRRSRRTRVAADADLHVCPSPSSAAPLRGEFGRPAPRPAARARRQLVPEPGHLPARVAPGRLPDPVERLVERVSPRRTAAARCSRWRSCRDRRQNNPAAHQPRTSSTSPPATMRRRARRCARVEHVARQLEHEDEGVQRPARCRRRVPVPPGQRRPVSTATSMARASAGDPPRGQRAGSSAAAQRASSAVGQRRRAGIASSAPSRPGERRLGEDGVRQRRRKKPVPPARIGDAAARDGSPRSSARQSRRSGRR